MHRHRLDRSFHDLQSLSRPDLSEGGLFSAPLTMGSESLYAKWASAPEDSGALRREYLLLSRLNHPNWPRARGFLQRNDGCSVLLTSAAEGIPIDRLDIPNLSIRFKVEIARQMLSALQALHSIRVAHLDLKPEHILVDLSPNRGGPKGDPAASEPPGLPAPADGIPPIRVTLLDLNLATPFGKPARSGNKGHLAPEFAQGRQIATAAIDLYGFGILLFQLLTGERPFSGTNFEALIRNKLNARLREVEPESYGGLSSVLFSLLSARPDRRQESAAEVWNQLRDIHIPTSPAAGAARLIRSEALPFVGRDAECAQFETWLTESARATGSSRCILSGPTGIGRRRLQQVLLTTALSHGWNGTEEIETTGPHHFPSYRITKFQPSDGLDAPTLTLDVAVAVPVAEVPPTDSLNATCDVQTEIDRNDGLHIRLEPIRYGPLAEAVRSCFGTPSLQDRLSRVSLGVPGVLVSLIPQVPDSDDLGVDIDAISREGSDDLTSAFESAEPDEAVICWFRDFWTDLSDEAQSALALLSLLQHNPSGEEQQQLWSSALQNQDDTHPGSSPPALSRALGPALAKGLVIKNSTSFAFVSRLWDQAAKRELMEARQSLGQRALNSEKLSTSLQIQVSLSIGSWDRFFEAWPTHARNLLDHYYDEPFLDLFNQVLGSVPNSHLGQLRTWAAKFVECSLYKVAAPLHVRARDLVALDPDDPALQLLDGRIEFHKLRAAPTDENRDAARQVLSRISNLRASEVGLDPNLSPLAFGLQLTLWGELKEYDGIKDYIDSALADLPTGPNVIRMRYLSLAVRLSRFDALYDVREYRDQLGECLEYATPRDRHIYTLVQTLWSAQRGLPEARALLKESSELAQKLHLTSLDVTLRQVAAMIAFEQGSVEECRQISVLTLRRSTGQSRSLSSLVQHLGNLSLVHLDLGQVNAAKAFLDLVIRTQATTASYDTDVLEYELVFASAVGDDSYVLERLEKLGRSTTLRPMGYGLEFIALFRMGHQPAALELFEKLVPVFYEREEVDDLFNLTTELLQCAIDMDEKDIAGDLYKRIDEFAEASTIRTRLFLDLAENDMVRRGWLVLEPAEAERRLLDSIIDVRRYHHTIREWRAHWNIATFYESTERNEKARGHRKEAHKQLEGILSGISDGRIYDCFRELPAVVAFQKESHDLKNQEVTP